MCTVTVLCSKQAAGPSLAIYGIDAGVGLEGPGDSGAEESERMQKTYALICSSGSALLL